MYELFKARAEAVSAEVHRARNSAEALELIAHVLKAEHVADEPGSYAVWADCPFLADVDPEALAAATPGLRFDVTRQSASAARVGISQVQWAIADTGTVAQDASSADSRLASTLTATHIALVPGDALVPDLASYLAVQSPRASAYVALITGPSRTADIERVLTIGVHGPEKLIVIVVDGLGGTR